jgi:hypothetical protein
MGAPIMGIWQGKRLTKRFVQGIAAATSAQQKKRRYAQVSGHVVVFVIVNIPSIPKRGKNLSSLFVIFLNFS